MCGHLKFAYEMPKWTTPNWITQNWTLRSKTKAFIANSSCEMCALWDITHCRELIHNHHFGTTY